MPRSWRLKTLYVCVSTYQGIPDNVRVFRDKIDADLWKSMRDRMNDSDYVFQVFKVQERI